LLASSPCPGAVVSSKVKKGVSHLQKSIDKPLVKVDEAQKYLQISIVFGSVPVVSSSHLYQIYPYLIL